MEGHDPLRLFQRSVAAGPDRAALRIGDASWTYAELDALSDAVARSLIEAGAYRERVLVPATKAAETYAAILGTLKAGCAYVPLHPDGPKARWQRMAEITGARFSIGADELLPGVRALAPGPENLIIDALPIVPEMEAYVLFTSGSTGGPKGVSISRANVAAYLHHQLSTHDFQASDLFTQFFALTFDLSVHDLFVCWGAGACLCVPPDDPLRSAAFVRSEGITCWFSVPSLADLLVRMRALKPGSLPQLRYAFFCGEALKSATANVFADAAPQAAIFNLYGPTETTIAITAHRFKAAEYGHLDIVAIGQVFQGHRTRIVDEELQISGPQLSAGYVGDDAATQRSFVQDEARTRWYRTGDRVRTDSNGVLHYAGRLDDQVKIAGHRVEPAEVDVLLSPALPGARCLTIAADLSGSLRLVTFIDTPFDALALRSLCQLHLPSYMQPFSFVSISEWPLTAHGKTDRLRLREIAQQAHP